MSDLTGQAVQLAFAGLRSGIQYVVAGLITWLASLGIPLDPDQSSAVGWLVGGVIFGLVVAGIRWLETRQGDGWQAWARKLGAILMLGTSVLQPSYGQRTQPVSAPTGSSGSPPVG